MYMKEDNTRKGLLTSREYWVALISVNLWTINGCKEKNNTKYEKIAEKIVDDDFMNRIYELSDPKDLIDSINLKK